MKIYLDDVRECPIGFTLCRTAKEALKLLDKGVVTHISFDHDLGTKLTGYDVAKWIEAQAAYGMIPDVPIWRVHSANPVGRENIHNAMESAMSFIGKGR